MQFIDLKRQYAYLKKEIDGAVAEVLTRGDFIGGIEVKELSDELARYCGVKHCLTVANGTDALTLALRTLGVQSGDAVFLPSFTFFATAEAVALQGAVPVFVDADERTFNISPERLEEAVVRTKKEGRAAKGIITVDLFGLPADYSEIRKIADSHGLWIIEDGAQGFGGKIGDKRACSFGDISTTSFFPAKPLGCYGDGGAVFTDNDGYSELLKSLAVHGKGSFKYDNVRIGYNSRLDTLQAAVLKVKLKAFINEELNSRNEIAARYTAALSDKFVTPIIPDGFYSSWAQYTLILESAEQRGQIQAALKEKGIPSMIYYPIPMHRQTAFKDCKANFDELRVSDNLSQRVLSLPMHPYLERNEQDLIIDCLLKGV